MIQWILVLAVGMFVNALSLSEWQSMYDVDRLGAIYDDRLEEVYFEIEDIQQEPLKSELPKMLKDALFAVEYDEIANDIDGMENVASLGEIQLIEITEFKVEGRVVAIGLTLFQDGVASESGTPSQSHYDSVEDAEAEGLDTRADVCWSAQVFFEWQDNQWSALSYSDYEGRGFRWCGW